VRQTVHIFKYIGKLIQVGLLVLLVIIVESSNTTKENKILYDNYNKSIDLSTMTLKLKEDIENDLYSAKDTYTGDLTGYVANCPLCTGKLACLPNYNVLNGVVNYQDISYGSVRIVASSSNLSCGTIIRFNKSSISSEPIIAIVLDRGVLGNDIDLLSVDTSYATGYVGRATITYDVLRNGWQ
jgi:hypothetical protein